MGYYPDLILALFPARFYISTKTWPLSTLAQGWVVSSALVGAVAGAAVNGVLADVYGRKKVIVATAAVFAVTALPFFLWVKERSEPQSAVKPAAYGFFEAFAEAVEIEDVTTLNSETVFRDLDEWSSLSFLSVIAMLDEEYDIQIENAQFRELKTLGDIVTYIELTKHK